MINNIAFYPINTYKLLILFIIHSMKKMPSQICTGSKTNNKNKYINIYINIIINILIY